MVGKMNQKIIELEGVEFRLNPLRPRHVLKIMKNLTQLIGAGFKGGSKIEVMAAVSDGLRSMEDDDFEALCLVVLCTTQVITKDGPLEITSPEAFDQAFTGVGIENLFVLLYEVLVFNRFPLVRSLDLDIGELIQGIELSLKEEEKPEASETNMENQENSVTS